MMVVEVQRVRRIGAAANSVLACPGGEEGGLGNQEAIQKVGNQSNSTLKSDRVIHITWAHLFNIVPVRMEVG